MIRRPHRGIALVLVLWVLALLTVMAIGLTTAQRTETALSDNHVSAAQFRAAADAAIAFTVLLLSMPPPDPTNPEVSVWLPNGTAHPWRFGGLNLSIQIFNETSRIDLSSAPAEVLKALLTLIGAEDETASAVAAAIVDWRDEDDLRMPEGAEDQDYKDAGRPIGAKDNPFTMVEELQQVLGMTPELYRGLADEVSVDLEGAGFTERFASPTAISALQGIPLEEAQNLVAERDAPVFEDGSAPPITDRGGPLYRLRISETGAGRGGRRMEALVEVMPGMEPPYRMRWRRFGLSSQQSMPVAPDAG